VLVGGPEVSADNPFVLAQSGFDIAVTGEAEDTFGQVMRRLVAGEDVKGLPGVAVRTLTGHAGRISSVAFSPDGNFLATGSRDNSIRVWDMQTGTAVQTLIGHKGGVTSVMFAPDGKQLASGSEDNTVRLWEVSTGKTMRTLAAARPPDLDRHPAQQPATATAQTWFVVY
jgi:WD40 repeat protein